MDDKDVIAALVSALRPFALAAERDPYIKHNELDSALEYSAYGDTSIIYISDKDVLTLAHLRAAADALRATGHDIEGGDA